jgi:cystathionine beta-lyase
MRIETKVATIACCAPETYQGVVNMPPFRASTILFPSLADFEAGERGEWPHAVYGRYGTPSSETLEQVVAELEGADHAIVFASGLAAITAALFAFVKAGDHILIADSVYGPTRRLCDQELSRFGVEVTYYDPLIGAGIASLMRDNTRVVYCESPGSLTFEMQDIPAIAAEAHRRGALVIADNTWATSLHFRPFDKGVDISMHSLTKYFAGHSDLVMGSLSCKAEHYKRLLRAARNFGAKPSADDCYLAMRGLRTMAVRVKQQESNALAVAGWLTQRPEVERVLHPALPGHPGHALWKRDMQGATALFSVILKPCSHAALAAFIDGMRLFHLGFSWGGFESLIIPFDLEKVRSATKPAYAGQGIRLHIGLEHPEDLIADLEAGFARMRAADAAVLK